LTGPSSQLKAIEDGLLRYTFEKLEQGIEIKVFAVVLRASFMSPEFREKSFTVRCSCVKRFMHAILSRIEWARTRRSDLQPKLKARPSTSCDSCASLSAVAIATGVSS